MNIVVSSGERRLRKGVIYVALALFCTYCLFPFLWMLDTAFKPLHEVTSISPTFWIREPTLRNFDVVLFDSNFLIYFRNSLIVATAATLLTLPVSIFASYALSRWSAYSIPRLIGTAMVVSQMIPGVLLLVPLYVLIRQMGLLSTYLALVLVYTTFLIPLVTFMLKGFFDSIPMELEEAAELDGCSRLGFIWRVLLPLSAPGLVATGVFAFVAAWNEFMFGYVLNNDDIHRTLTPGIMIFKGSHQTDWGALMAASVLAVVPVAICFIYLQRFLVEGLGVGAVKG